MDAVLSWGAVALFVGPLVAAIAMIVFRWVLNQGYGPHALILGLLLYGGYRLRPTPAPVPVATATARAHP